MLQTHFIKTKPGENPNLFPLVIEDLLSDHLINSVGGGVTTYPLGSEWKRYKDTIYKLDKRYKEFINQGFQIFISTYDRSWYETARNFFATENQKFKTIELFVNDHDNDPATPDIPVIIDPGLDYFERAKAFFKAKDFPAAANYLRKACESELRRILPAQMTLLVDHNTDEVRKITKLEILVGNFFTFLNKNSLDQAPFQHFKTYKKIILNPLSHDDLETPHYRNEIRDGINLAENLKKIKSKVIHKAKDSAEKPLKLGMRDTATNGMHIYEIQVLENLHLLQQDSSPIQLSSINCEVREGTTKRKFDTLNLAFDQLRVDRGCAASANYDDFYNHIKVSNRKKLIDIMTFE